jgi:hypothetical protein
MFDNFIPNMRYKRFSNPLSQGRPYVEDDSFHRSRGAYSDYSDSNPSGQNPTMSQRVRDSFSQFFQPRTETLSAGEQNPEMANLTESYRQYHKSLADIAAEGNPELERFKAHLGAYPTQEQYEPGLAGKLGAALVGFGTGYTEGPTAGIRAGQAARLAPLNRARSEWEQQLRPLEFSAGLEEKAQTGKEALAGKQFEKAIALGKEGREATRTTMQNYKSLSDIARNDVEMQHIQKLIDTANFAGLKDMEDGTLAVVGKDGSITPTKAKTLEGKNVLSLIQRRADETRLGQQNVGLRGEEVNIGRGNLNERIAERGIRGTQFGTNQDRLKMQQNQQALRFLYENHPNGADLVKVDPATGLLMMDTPQADMPRVERPPEFGGPPRVQEPILGGKKKKKGKVLGEVKQ